MGGDALDKCLDDLKNTGVKLLTYNFKTGKLILSKGDTKGMSGYCAANKDLCFLEKLKEASLMFNERLLRRCYRDKIKAKGLWEKRLRSKGLSVLIDFYNEKTSDVKEKDNARPKD